MECARALSSQNGGGGSGGGELSPQQARNLRQFVAVIDEIRASLVVMRPAEVIDSIVEKTGYAEYLREEAEKTKKKKKAAAEGDDDYGGGEDSDDDDDEQQEHDSGNDSDVMVEGGETQTETGEAMKDGDGNSVGRWPYHFRCKLTGPLKRLQAEAVKWVEEYEPKLGLSSPSSSSSSSSLSSSFAHGGVEPRGPPSLESLCYASLSSPKGIQALHQLVHRASGSNDANSSSHSAADVLRSTALEVVAAASACGAAPLAEFQSYLRLGQTDIAADSISSADLGVNISTIHAAKGLEWNTVLIPRFNEGFLPAVRTTAVEDDDNDDDSDDDDDDDVVGEIGQQNVVQQRGGGGGPLAMAAVAPPPPPPLEELRNLTEEQEQMDEERRLAHVAITRAKEKLYMSYITVNARFEEVERSSILNTIMERCGSIVEFLEREGDKNEGM